MRRLIVHEWEIEMGQKKKIIKRRKKRERKKRGVLHIKSSVSFTLGRFGACSALCHATRGNGCERFQDQNL